MDSSDFMASTMRVMASVAALSSLAEPGLNNTWTESPDGAAADGGDTAAVSAGGAEGGLGLVTGLGAGLDTGLGAVTGLETGLGGAAGAVSGAGGGVTSKGGGNAGGGGRLATRGGGGRLATGGAAGAGAIGAGSSGLGGAMGCIGGGGGAAPRSTRPGGGGFAPLGAFRAWRAGGLPAARGAGGGRAARRAGLAVSCVRCFLAGGVSTTSSSEGRVAFRPLSTGKRGPPPLMTGVGPRRAAGGLKVRAGAP